jgi:hypothetical protein
MWYLMVVICHVEYRKDKTSSRELLIFVRYQPFTWGERIVVENIYIIMCLILIQLHL